jgi:large subunit ribosomal protein L15
MPLYRRIPKRGFKSRNKVKYKIIKLTQLNSFPPHSEVTPELLYRKKFLSKGHKFVKILDDGGILNIPLEIRVNKISASARAKVESCGGRVTII